MHEPGGISIDPDAVRRESADIQGMSDGLYEVASFLRSEHDVPTMPLNAVEADSGRYGDDLVRMWQDVVNGYAQATDRWMRAVLALGHAVNAMGVTAGNCAKEFERMDRAEATQWLQRVRGE